MSEGSSDPSRPCPQSVRNHDVRAKEPVSRTKGLRSRLPPTCSVMVLFLFIILSLLSEL